uniref:Uncharacterized protein n=1 Tax=Arundo donax TaxID=35708 RepID=A0A0A9DTE8_ARUDO
MKRTKSSHRGCLQCLNMAARGEGQWGLPSNTLQTYHAASCSVRMVVVPRDAARQGAEGLVSLNPHHRGSGLGASSGSSVATSLTGATTPTSVHIT